jgi:hypothetical protein
MPPIRSSVRFDPPPHFVEDFGLAAEEEKVVFAVKSAFRDLQAGLFEFHGVAVHIAPGHAVVVLAGKDEDGAIEEAFGHSPATANFADAKPGLIE